MPRTPEYYFHDSRHYSAGGLHAQARAEATRMTTTLKDLIAQRAALDAQIAATQAAERIDAIQKVRALMADHGLTIEDLSTRAPRGSKTSEPSKVAAKYRDQETGATWSGRGLKPKWLSGKLAAGAKLEDFAV